MVNALTRHTGFTLGPIVLETLIKHYFERVAKETESEETTKLRKEELLYDEAFNIIKSFMAASTKHTVEELQAFSNMRTPSPPWVHVVRLLVPMSKCDEAAGYLIKALGGEEMTKRVVGGTKWWQVRGIKGIDGEWIVAKKDWQEVKRKQKSRAMSMDDAPQGPASEYKPEMDQMRCILYAHGGGYYFGSIDQERYSIQRFARKINGRVFAVNYRLAPQYPFPCAIQDFLAAYLYLIRPPPDALHTPIAPENIVFGGDSAGGGLCIALLQVIRDSGLPPPAGAFLISPWCDLTHSFPSIHLNTATDIIPETGLSLYKPSTLWPPPPDDLTTRVHQGLRQRIREAVHSKAKDGSLVVPPNASTPADPDAPPRPTTPDYSVPLPSPGLPLHLGSTVSLPSQNLMDGVRSQRVALTTTGGEELVIDTQVHMYAPNYLVGHPLVSPVVSYLGGLPPLFVIASEKEVLRDEIIYFAHKAAHPDKYPVKADARAMYPALEGIEQRYPPTKVHLQVYDDCAHTLPILFAFTTPAKYCFRAIATFIKHTTGLLPKTPVPPSPPEDVLSTGATTYSPASTQLNLVSPNPEAQATATPPLRESSSAPTPLPASKSDSALEEPKRSAEATSASTPPPTGSSDPAAPNTGSELSKFKPKPKDKEKPRTPSMRRALSASVTRASTFLRRQDVPPVPAVPQPQGSGSSDVGGPRFHGRNSSNSDGVRYAGETNVYANGLDTMIRERISTRGEVRALEPESELAAFRLPPELIGDISELALRRYVDGSAKFARKFHKAAKTIEKARHRNLARAKEDATRQSQLRSAFITSAVGLASEAEGEKGKSREGEKEREMSGSWPWAWALDEDEQPPPSSIVSRRDTEEARRLAKIADQAVFMDAHAVSGNNLWSLIVNFLTTTPERDAHKHHHKHEHGDGAAEGEAAAAGVNTDAPVAPADQEKAQEKSETLSRRERIVSRFAWLSMENRKSHGLSAVSSKTSQNEQ